MEIAVNNVISDISRRRNPDLKSSNLGPNKKVPLQQKQDWHENTENVQLDEDQVRVSIEQINKTLALHSVRFEFSVHDKTNAIMVKVVDEQTGELIREVPPEKVLDIVAMTWEEMGFLIDEKA